uniref:Blue copper protein n=2 Tax=Cajanus cajan TaxID=3821 RepID=A0A151SLM9_CAJCA|nr:Blue copper protein [Cajanus cajan]
MVQLRNVAIVVAVVAAAVLQQSTKAEDYEVGGSTGWTSFPPGGDSFYSKWAENFTFKVKDTLVFNFESGSHSVVELSKANYEKCEVDKSIKGYNSGPARVRLDRSGEFYFSCSFSGHCSSGQKLSIKVTGSGSSSPPTPKNAPAEAPSSSASNEGDPSFQTHPAATAPPPQGSATSLTAPFSLFLITIAINFLSQF